MEESVTNPEAQAVVCPACSTSTSSADAFCNACGYPFQGTEKEQQIFISNRSLRSMDLDEAHRKLKRASNALFIVAALMAISGFIYYAANQEQEARSATLFFNLILGGLFAGLGFWAKNKPLAAIISGLSLYALVIIINLIVDPLTIARGIFFKIAIIGAFINGIKSAIEAEKIKKELNI